MQLGYTSMNTADDLPPGILAAALEERGFESLWVGEHSHIPASRRTPYPAGGELPDPYVRMMDPYVSLMAAAAASSTLQIGTGVALPLERDILALAKTVSTVCPVVVSSLESVLVGTKRSSRTIGRFRGRSATERSKSVWQLSRCCGVTRMRSSMGSSTTSNRCGHSPSRFNGPIRRYCAEWLARWA